MFGKEHFPHGAKILFFVTPILLILAAIMIILGVAMPFWLVTDVASVSTNTGLWLSCVNGFDLCTDSESGITGDVLTKWIVMRVLSIFACVFIFIAIFHLCLYPCFKLLNHGKVWVGGTVAVFAFLAAAAMIVAIVLMPITVLEIIPTLVYTDLPNYIGWAFYVCVVGAIFAFIGGVLMVIHLFIAVYY